jgi:hypothetical protein
MRKYVKKEKKKSVEENTQNFRSKNEDFVVPVSQKQASARYSKMMTTDTHEDDFIPMTDIGGESESSDDDERTIRSSLKRLLKDYLDGIHNDETRAVAIQRLIVQVIDLEAEICSVRLHAKSNEDMIYRIVEKVKLKDKDMCDVSSAEPRLKKEKWYVVVRGRWIPEEQRFESKMTNNVEEFNDMVKGVSSVVQASFDSYEEAEEYMETHYSDALRYGMARVHEGVFSTRWYQIIDHRTKEYVVTHDPERANELFEGHPERVRFSWNTAVAARSEVDQRYVRVYQFSEWSYRSDEYDEDIPYQDPEVSG